ncbi:hypothetical protein [Kitasatospora sp. NPDC085464]|uniref:hypothetical protein n=1 Tax=Kitasatospora sp. NPDC085464 TaxID=3364063 RepID=UPI0037C77A37
MATTMQRTPVTGVDENSTVVFPAPLMSTIGELGTFLVRETAAAAQQGNALVDLGKVLAVPLRTNGSAKTP